MLDAGLCPLVSTVDEPGAGMYNEPDGPEGFEGKGVEAKSSLVARPSLNLFPPSAAVR